MSAVRRPRVYLRSRNWLRDRALWLADLGWGLVVLTATGAVCYLLLVIGAAL